MFLILLCITYCHEAFYNKVTKIGTNALKAGVFRLLTGTAYQKDFM